MAYSTSNQPRLQSDMVNGPREWVYTSADAAATVDGAGYFTDGFALGMKKGDFVKVYDSVNIKWTGHVVVNVPSAVLAPDLSNGTTLADGSSNSD